MDVCRILSKREKHQKERVLRTAPGVKSECCCRGEGAEGEEGAVIERGRATRSPRGLRAYAAETAWWAAPG